MKPKTLIPLVMGAVVGGVAIKIVVDVVKSAEGASAANLATCVVANTDIAFAEEITAQKLAEVEWPKNLLPAQYFKTKDEVLGRVTGMPVPKDVPIYPNMLAPPGTPPGIQTRIKPGFRAVSVRIDEVSGVAYQVAPGDRIDVVALIKHATSGRATQNISRIILQNVEVAAVGRAIQPAKDKGGKKKGKLARSVTLLLKPEEVTKLHLAQSVGGKLSLALRGKMDEDESEIANATTDELLGMDEFADYEELASLNEMPADDPVMKAVKTYRRPADSWNVTVMNGNDVEQMKYRNRHGIWELLEVESNNDDNFFDNDNAIPMDGE